MNKTECQNESISAKTVGFLIIVASLFLLLVGLLILPVVGFVFALPLLLLGVGMIVAPESKTCRLIMDGLQSK